MTVQEARTIAQSDPVPVLSARWGELTARARNRVAALEDALRELEQVTRQLGDHDLVVATDLGVTGNSARAAWLAAQVDRDAGGFALPNRAA